MNGVGPNKLRRVGKKSKKLISILRVLSNIYATFKAQFMKKLRNTEAELKKSVAYKKSVYINLTSVLDSSTGIIFVTQYINY